MWNVWGKQKCIRAVVEKPEGKGPTGILKLRWEDNTKMDLQKTGCKGADWFHLAQDRDSDRIPEMAVSCQGP
jgi:hypothetical protein